MGTGKQAWGWYPAGKIWVPIQVAATGKLVIDPTAIFEEPPTNGEMEKGATSNWCFDHENDPDAHHDRQHALSSALDHTGGITDAQHGERTKADAHAHAHLSGVGANDHHVRYTDVEALAAARGVITSGSYTGNNSVNRAIPHGLGVTPKIVMITVRDTTAMFGNFYRIHGGIARIYYVGAVGGNARGRNFAVTAPSSTNFYVGNATDYTTSANERTIVYDWVAIG